MCCLRHRAIPVPWQLQYPSYATEASLANISLTTCASVAEGWTTCSKYWQLRYAADNPLRNHTSCLHAPPNPVSKWVQPISWGGLRTPVSNSD